MKKLISGLLLFAGMVTMAQNTSFELAPGVITNPMVASELDTFDLQFSFPCTAFVGTYGIESNGTDIYVSQWLGDSIVRYDVNGNVTDFFTITGVSRVRDMAWDGQYYYGSPNDFFFYVMDLNTQELISTITTPFKIRGMAYDEVNNELWASEHWQPMFYRMDMNGQVLDSWMAAGITMDAISGLAYDNTSSNGPFLWGFSQDSTGAMLVKYDIANQLQTGNIIDVTGLATEWSVAGGLYMADMNLKNGPTLGGVIQNQLAFALSLDYANQLVGAEEQSFVRTFRVYPNPASGHVTVTIDYHNANALQWAMTDITGRIVKQGTWTGQQLDLDVDQLQEGTYLIRLWQGNDFTLTKPVVVSR